MAAQGKSQLPQDMQKAHAGFRPRALALVFKPPRSILWRELYWPREDADCDVDNDNVHFDCLQEPITLGNQ